jgi:hypothetical protein
MGAYDREHAQWVRSMVIDALEHLAAPGEVQVAYLRAFF